MTIDSRGHKFSKLWLWYDIMIIIDHVALQPCCYKNIFIQRKQPEMIEGGLLDPSGSLCIKIYSPIVKVANVEVQAVCESQDTPFRSPYHVPFTMLAHILRLPKKVWLIHVYINYVYNARA